MSHILHPQEAGAQTQWNGELVPRQANGGVEQVLEVTEVQPQSKKNDQLRLRLDLNLDVEIELKAKIRGDVTLQLLYAFFRRPAFLPNLLTCVTDNNKSSEFTRSAFLGDIQCSEGHR